jgi:hypothetical protein
VAITLDDLKELLAHRRDQLVSVVRAVLLSGEQDPFVVDYSSYRAMSEDEQVELGRRAHALREDWIERQLDERRARWIVVAGEQVLAHGNDVESAPDDSSLERMGEGSGRAPFLFTRVLIEC